ncbi:MAG: protein kinase [Planctomycetaceae bacterium]|nr:protein kinase [Planctomycetaceae bacterium]
MLPFAKNDETNVLPAVPDIVDATYATSCDELVKIQPTDARNANHNESPAARNIAPLPNLGDRYRPLKKLGQGGMGAVYLAEDTLDCRKVAIKVLPAEFNLDQQAVQRFQKEMRMLSEVQHPNVANLLDSGVFGDTRFIVMEVVEGTDLKAVLQRHMPIPERVALEIIADVANALAVAHSIGIVHRDIKPANILLSAISADGESRDDAVMNAVLDSQPLTAKLTDFGLARHVDQGASMELTRTGMMLGTPYYISPEQCTDKGGITPAADIYSLGATLFELLTGRPPFLADDPIRLITMHCFDPAPDPRKIAPEIGDGVAAIVLKTLQKSPEARYADAAHFLQDLDSLLQGEVHSAEVHPHLPVTTGKVFEANWEWQLDGDPKDLWPHISNTERVNAAVGLPPVEYMTRRDEAGNKHRIGSFKLGWTRLSWEEHPFEWIEGRRFSILREFENGPFQWFVSTVELTPRAGGGSLLRHNVRIAARGLMGRLIAHIEVNIKGQKPLDRVYRRIDNVVCGRLSGSTITDPFVSVAPPAASVRKKLESYRERLSGDITDQSSLDKFLDVLAEGSPQDLARIRPRAMARQLGVAPDQLTNICLAACHAGLLELHWDILCPTCRVAAAVKDTLCEIDRHANCEACEHNFDVDFSSSVEMIFRIHPEIRQADLKTYCIGGPEHAPHVIAQIQIEVGEKFELDLNLDRGSYILRGTQLPYTIGIVAETTSGTNRLLIPLSPGQSKRRPACVHAGRQLITLVNEYQHPLLVRLERTTSRADVVTATEALKLPVFQQLFPSETITRERISSVATSTLLALRITNVLDLFADLGDSATVDEMAREIQAFQVTIESYEGKLIKEQDDRLLASFPTARQAIQAGLTLNQHNMESHSKAGTRIQVAIHRGVTMSTSLNGKLDYFGRSIAVASAMLNTSERHLLIVSQDLASDEDCNTQLTEAQKSLRPVSTNGVGRIFEICDSSPGDDRVRTAGPATAELHSIDTLQNDTTLQFDATPLKSGSEAQA